LKCVMIFWKVVRIRSTAAICQNCIKGDSRTALKVTRAASKSAMTAAPMRSSGHGRSVAHLLIGSRVRDWTTVNERRMCSVPSSEGANGLFSSCFCQLEDCHSFPCAVLWLR
jgi:hypothetical protein